MQISFYYFQRFKAVFVDKTIPQILHFVGPVWYSALWTLRESLFIRTLSQMLQWFSLLSVFLEPGQILSLILSWWCFKVNSFKKDFPQNSHPRVLSECCLCFVSWCLFKLKLVKNCLPHSSQVFFLKELRVKNMPTKNIYRITTFPSWWCLIEEQQRTESSLSAPPKLYNPEKSVSRTGVIIHIVTAVQ